MGSVLLALGYAATGLAAGTLGGLVGIGGGIIMIPVLSLLFHIDMQTSIAASLFAMIFISAASTYGHWKNGYVLKPVVIRLIPLAAVSAIIGVIASTRFPGWILQMTFAVFMVLTAADSIFRLARGVARGAVDEVPVHEFRPKNEWVTPLVSVPMGLVCGILGIGGGTIVVPALHTFLRLPLKNAVANSSAGIVFVSVIAAAAKIAAIDGVSTIVDGSRATLHWYGPVKVGLFLAPTAVVGGILGARLAKTTAIIRAIFAVVLIYSAWEMWHKGADSKRAAEALAPVSPAAVTAPANPGNPSSLASPAAVTPAPAAPAAPSPLP